jgi:PKD repeat protein
VIAPRTCALLSAALLVAACGGSSSSTAPTSTPSSGVPSARFTVKVDAAGSRDAVAALSDVMVDASANGIGLSYQIDFGDGASAFAATAHHTYAASGTYTIVVTVTNRENKSSSNASIVVHDATGSWYQAGVAKGSKRVEVRNLTIDAQSDASVRGTYRVAGNAATSFTGTLTPPRAIRLTTDGGVTLDGTLPGRLNDDAELWTLMDHGDSADGQGLDFHAITGVPDGVLPVAALSMSVEGNLVKPIAGVTPVHLDAGASRGSGLSYFLEYGDGFVATTPQADHVVDAPSVPAQEIMKEWNTVVSATARVTVVDRFGRSDSTSAGYQTFDFGATSTAGDGKQYWKSWDPFANVSIFQRSGGQFTGFLSVGYVSSPCTLTVTGGTHVHLSAPDLGLEFDGTVAIDRYYYADTMTLIQHGGALDGRTYVLHHSSDY